MRNFYKIDYKILTIFMLFSFSNVFSQCLNPSFFQSHSTTINSSVIQWTDVNEAEYYRVSYRQIGEDWQFAGLPINIPFGTNLVELNNLEEYTKNENLSSYADKKEKKAKKKKGRARSYSDLTVSKSDVFEDEMAKIIMDAFPEILVLCLYHDIVYGNM